MAATTLRILLLADTHLGIDAPVRPRVERRRRGPDFFANFERALAPALAGEVQALVHGGDLLYRSRVPPSLVSRAFEPLRRVADAGVPVFLVPGNHERSHIPYPILAAHSLVEIFTRPETFAVTLGGIRLALSGFPFQPDGVRAAFSELVEQTGWRATAADVRLLCLHEAVEGARVGPAGYTFRSRPDVVRGRDIPHGFAAVVSGHIHRHQMLERDLAGRRLPAPVLYPGSIERTSFAERDEPKGFVTLDLVADGTPGGRLARWCFHRLPARPMADVTLPVAGLGRRELARCIRERLARLDPASIVRLRLEGVPAPGASEVLSAQKLRALAPPSMNLELARPRPSRPGP